MRHRVKGKKLNRNRSSRKALTKGLLQNMIEHEKIETTLMKAKFVQPDLEKAITRAKTNTLANRRILIRKIGDRESVKKLLEDLGPRFAKREGGYTRIRRSIIRDGDSAQMAELSFVESKKKEPKAKKSTTKKETKVKDKPAKKEASKEVEKKETKK